MSSPNDEHDRVPGLERLQMQRAPERDLWPGIASRLRPRGRFAPPQWLAAAACAVLALSVMLQSGLQTPAEPEAQAALPYATSAQPALARAPMRSEMRGLVRANLHVVEGAEKQIRQAMAYDPDSAMLARLLARSREQRRDLRQLLART